MILTSANTLENKEIVEYKGLVTGESLIGANTVSYTHLRAHET